VLRRRRPEFDELHFSNWLLPDLLHSTLGRHPYGRAIATLINQLFFDALGVFAVLRHRPAIYLCRQGAGKLSLRAARRAGVPAVLLTISPDPYDEAAIVERASTELNLRPPVSMFPKEMSRRRLRSEYQANSEILSSSSYAADSLIRAGVDPNRVFILPRSAAIRPERDSFRAESDSVRILYVGQIAVRKGLHVLWRAADILSARGLDDVVIDIAGGVVDRAYMEHLTATKPPTVTVLGHVPKQDLPALYERSDVFVLPTLSDAFGMVVSEAQAFGLPVVITDRCGAPVVDGKTGVVVPAGDANALAAALLTLCKDRLLRRTLGSDARNQLERWPWSEYRRVSGQWLEGVITGVPFRPVSGYPVPIGRPTASEDRSA
jgi:glycosyltransferase involved in cell wall biosynthesis